MSLHTNLICDYYMPIDVFSVKYVLRRLCAVIWSRFVDNHTSETSLALQMICSRSRKHGHSRNNVSPWPWTRCESESKAFQKLFRPRQMSGSLHMLLSLATGSTTAYSLAFTSIISRECRIALQTIVAFRCWYSTCIHPARRLSKG